ncbi:MAG TPA: protein kinase [Nannocystaceae bacterium]|nr:protein kinase [Nannocystaceae bacterium]
MDGRLADPASLHGATLLGRYRIESLIGQGGMAFVYAGRHIALDREVAIKVLRPRHARRPKVVERFLQEARAASRVRHDHIAEVTDFGSTPDGVVFMVMDRLVGETLAETLERDGTMAWPRARDIVLQLCEALQAAHDHGVVHRDVSLKNCFRLAHARHPDFVKLLDFGIARVIGEAGPSGELRRLTAETQIMGTPEFMSPEQATRSYAVDWRSDIYALGVVLYALLTGRLPFEAATAVDLMARHIYEPVPPPSRHEPTLAPAVEAIVMRALEKDPSRRFQAMTELADALRAVPDDARCEVAESPTPVIVSASLPGPALVPPRRRTVLRLAMAGVALALAWWTWRGDDGAVVVDTADAMASPVSSKPSATPPASPTRATAAIVAAPAAEPVAARTMRAAIVPPPPPPDWRERSRGHAKPRRVAEPPSAEPPSAEPPVEPIPIAAPAPTADLSAPIEPTPVIVPAIAAAPDPAQTIGAIEEVKNPFAE